jgi:hypothetical protein
LETQAIIPLILAQKETRNIQPVQVTVAIFTTICLSVGVAGLRIRIRIILGSPCRVRGSGSALFWEASAGSASECKAGSGSGSALKSKLMSFRGSKWSCGRPNLEMSRIKMEPRRVCRPVIADWHHFYEEPVPDPGPNPKKLEILCS